MKDISENIKSILYKHGFEAKEDLINELERFINAKQKDDCEDKKEEYFRSIFDKKVKY